MWSEDPIPSCLKKATRESFLTKGIGKALENTKKTTKRTLEKPWFMRCFGEAFWPLQVATRGSILYFVIADLANINPMHLARWWGSWASSRSRNPWGATAFGLFFPVINRVSWLPFFDPLPYVSWILVALWFVWWYGTFWLTVPLRVSGLYLSYYLGFFENVRFPGLSFFIFWLVASNRYLQSLSGWLNILHLFWLLFFFPWISLLQNHHSPRFASLTWKCTILEVKLFEYLQRRQAALLAAMRYQFSLFYFVRLFKSCMDKAAKSYLDAESER